VRASSQNSGKKIVDNLAGNFAKEPTSNSFHEYDRFRQSSPPFYQPSAADAMHTKPTFQRATGANIVHAPPPQILH